MKVAGKVACESCLMPFAKDAVRRRSDRYCSLCFRDGKLCYEGSDLKEFQRLRIEGMRARGINPLQARFYTFMIGFAPRWRQDVGAPTRSEK